LRVPVNDRLQQLAVRWLGAGRTSPAFQAIRAMRSEENVSLLKGCLASRESAVFLEGRFSSVRYFVREYAWNILNEWVQHGTPGYSRAV
jgi:hypothetical protein